MIFDIIQELKNEPSKNAKIEILRGEIDNELLKKVIVATYSPYIQYYIRKIPDYVPDRVGTLSLDHALDSLSQLTERKVTGNAAQTYLVKLLENVNQYDAEVLVRVVKKSLDCGMTESTANKVWPKLVPTYPCLLAKSVDEKTIKRMTWPAYSQLKADGMRINAHVDADGNVTLRGRSGKTVDLLGSLDAEILELAKGTPYIELMFDGELVVMEDDGTIMDRKKGNGIINKAIRGKISQAEADRVCIRVWDVITNEAFRAEIDTTPYSTRFELVKNAVATFSSPRVGLIETIEVADIGAAQKHFKQMLKRGEEGTLLKSKDHAWEDKRSYGLLKFKAIKDADLKVVDWQEGTGKYAGKLGALVCQSSDGKVEVSIGSGFSDAQREEFTRESTIDKIVEILYNERISDKSRPGVDSLFLPRFVELREDKDVANSSKEIK
jgi:hypothetical protein